MTQARVLCIVGPTAIGKSDLANEVARKVHGEIVSVDSMQVYRGMDIGTAKVPAAEREHLHMVDVADVSEHYSVTRFQRDARTCVNAIAERGAVPILCGGSGLYLDAVIDDMSFPPGKIGDETRASYDKLAERHGAQWIYDLLCERDPKSAELIHPNNTRRVIRALELHDDGKSYYEHHKGLRKRKPYYEAKIWGLTMPRDALYARIDARVDDMVRLGLLGEVTELERLGLRESSTASQAIGYREMLSYLDGQYDFEQAVELIKRNTRRYAKRQLSWLKRDGRARMIDVASSDKYELAEIISRDWGQS